MNKKWFNVRVYGLLINELNQILVSDEVFGNGIRATKFPGGGLEFGEGTVDCLKREFREEAGIAINVTQHFYTTDFFQQSYLDADSQIISIYYLIETADWRSIKVSATPFAFVCRPGEENMCLRWLPLSKLVSEATIILPIDKIVVKLLAKQR